MDPVTTLTAKITASYLENNRLTLTDLPVLLQTVHKALRDIVAPPAPEPEAAVPAVPIKKSVTPDHIICLEDGKKLKMLKRYLRTAYDMSPEEYRAKWGLPSDYPMVAPNYSKARSTMARSIGLGSRGRGAKAPEPVSVAETPETKAAPRRRRAKKT
ncbi:MucR family transcriptional regulator [Indioceanicola profundi]|uniref:MucR family transcriptional regulator n=1 Tax=Indioceanicola profundi TaxID=2220096 RepID=UPI000E6ACCCC|nr:MucR family transcriptional regulator [Indioceanicola profundi]